jgi:hypothetical protein
MKGLIMSEGAKNTMKEYTKEDLRKIDLILKNLELAARKKIAVIGCKEASLIFKKNQGYFSQVANGKRPISAKKALAILKTIQEHQE